MFQVSQGLADNQASICTGFPKYSPQLQKCKTTKFYREPLKAERKSPWKLRKHCGLWQDGVARVTPERDGLTQYLNRGFHGNQNRHKRIRHCASVVKGHSSTNK